MIPIILLYASLVNDVRGLIARHDEAAAERAVRTYQSQSGATSELGLHLCIGPLVAEDYGDCGHVAARPGSQLLRALQSEMPIHHFAVAAGQHRTLEPEFANRGAHAVHDRVVLPRISGVEDKALDGPCQNLRGLSRRFLRKHTSPRFGEESSAGCARGAGPAN